MLIDEKTLVVACITLIKLPVNCAPLATGVFQMWGTQQTNMD